MTRGLRISDQLSLPANAVSQTLVAYGGKGMGKTNLIAVLCECLAELGLRFSLLDPVGVSWGLQYGADRSKKGLPVLVLGGIHGDIPIEPTAGKVVADLVADESVSTVIDISRHANGRMWSNAEKIRFVADYCTHLYERQGERRVPIMQVIDEAGRFCPQQIPHGSPDLARCVGAIEGLVELGRNVGVGVTLVTQRSARMNKSVSELAECMVAFRTVGPRSVDAVMDWLGEHIEKGRAKDLVEKLRSLPVGHALVVSPGWLGFEGVVRIRARTTFDSSRTPETGDSASSHGKATKPDLAKYRTRMAQTIEKAEANDPRALRARIAELERKLAAKVPPAAPAPRAKDPVRPKQVSVLKDGHVKRIEATACGIEKASARTLEALAEVLKLVRASMTPAAAVPAARPVVRPTVPLSAVRPLVIAARAEGRPQNGTHEALPPARQRILDSLAWLESIEVRRADRGQLGFLSGQSPNSGGYANNLGALRTMGLIDYPSNGEVCLTDAGRQAAAPQDQPRSNEDLHRLVMEKLPPARQRILRALIDAYPQDMAKDLLAEASGQSPNSGGYANNLGAMRSIGVLDYPAPGRVRAADIMFLSST